MRLHEPLASPRLGVAKARVSEVALATFLGDRFCAYQQKWGNQNPEGTPLPARGAKPIRNLWWFNARTGNARAVGKKENATEKWWVEKKFRKWEQK